MTLVVFKLKRYYVCLDLSGWMGRLPPRASALGRILKGQLLADSLLFGFAVHQLGRRDVL